MRYSGQTQEHKWRLLDLEVAVHCHAEGNIPEGEIQNFLLAVVEAQIGQTDAVLVCAEEAIQNLLLVVIEAQNQMGQTVAVLVCAEKAKVDVS